MDTDPEHEDNDAQHTKWVSDYNKDLKLSVGHMIDWGLKVLVLVNLIIMLVDFYRDSKVAFLKKTYKWRVRRRLKKLYKNWE